MSAFPRTLVPTEITPLALPAAFLAASQSGKVQTRASLAVGRTWSEIYQTFSVDQSGAWDLITFLTRVRHSGETFTISWLRPPSGATTPRGSGTGSPLVNGASQTGTTLSTKSWTGSNPVLKAGDPIKVGVIPYVFTLVNDAPNLSGGITALDLDLPILAGQSPADSATVYYTGISITAVLVEVQMPRIPSSGFVAGMIATFREAP